MKNSISDEEANKMLNEILEEDGEQSLDDEDSETCSAACAEENPAIEKKSCECTRIAVNASRFSLRVMEAMRSLQHDEDATLPTSTVEDIVGYIEANYRDDGDLYAQVRTALKQVCSQGLPVEDQSVTILTESRNRFAVELLENEYHLIGPDAISMNRTTCSNDRGDCLLSSPVKTPPKRRRRESLEDDSCDCETPTAEESRLANKRGRFSTGDQSLRRILGGRVTGIGRQDRGNDSRGILDLEEGEEDAASEDIPQCSCSLTLSNEDVENCECSPQMDKSANTSTMQKTLRSGQGRARKNGNGNDRGGTQFRAAIGEEKRSKSAQDTLVNTSGRRSYNGEGNGMVTDVADTVRDGKAEGKKGEDGKDSVTDGTISDTVRHVHREIRSQIPCKGSRQREKELERWIKRCQEECERRRNRK